MDSEEVIQGRCAGWLAEAIEQRREVAKAMPKPETSPEKVSEALITVRAHLDRVEAIYLSTLIFRAIARAGAARDEEAQASAWDAKSAVLRQTAVGDRYQSGDQHRADVNLEILPVITVARTSRRIAALADETARQVEVVYRGIDGTRRDIASRLGYLQWEKHLER